MSSFSKKEVCEEQVVLPEFIFFIWFSEQLCILCGLEMCAEIWQWSAFHCSHEIQPVLVKLKMDGKLPFS